MDGWAIGRALKRALRGARRIGVYPGQYFDSESGLHYNFRRYYSPILGRYLRIDPIGLQGGFNLFVYSQNNPLKYWDSFGLNAECKDAAGRKCCCDNMGTIYLLVDSSDEVGHAFLKVGNRMFGFYPNPQDDVYVTDYFFGDRSVRGITQNDSDHKWQKGWWYKACPETKDRLIDSALSNAFDRYQLGNRGNRNCAGWAAERLRDVGITPPAIPELDGLKPHHLSP